MSLLKWPVPGLQVVECGATLPHSLAVFPACISLHCPQNLITLYLRQAKLTFAPIHDCIVTGRVDHTTRKFSLPSLLMGLSLKFLFARYRVCQV